MTDHELTIDGHPITQTQDLKRVYARRLEVFGPTPEALLYTNTPTNHVLKMEDYAEILAILLRTFPGSLILDIGCGYGSLARAVPPNRYYGIDVVEGFIECARGQNPDHRFEATTLEEFTGMADIGVLAGVMGAVPDPFGLLGLAWETCRMGIVVDFNFGDEMPAGSFNKQCRDYQAEEVEPKLGDLAPNFRALKRHNGWTIYFLPRQAGI